VANLALLRYHRAQQDTQVTETTIPAPPGFSQLSKAEQLRYLQALWDQIAENPADLPVPESHLKLVEERLKRHRDDASPSHSAFQIIDRLSNEST
jgi:uncharacterized coiled-coil protein SlyX